MKTFFIILYFLLGTLGVGFTQQKEPPKLIIGIVIDQMRAEYLYRFQNNYSENGFKKLIKEGLNLKNVHYNYIPTETAPGHASIYTGTTPANHGIIANHWFIREKNRIIYCVDDSSEHIIGNGASNLSLTGASPRNLLTSTFADELKLFSNKRSKAIGISLKDRAAILPVGHLADFAFWYDEHTGYFVSSTYYNQNLPNWVNSFNAQKRADMLFNKTWDFFLPIEKYSNSNNDDVKFERIYIGNNKSTFPYSLKQLKEKNGGYRLLMETPFGNTLLTDFAIETIKKEKLGQHHDIDFLSISFSSTDKVGHDFGIRSKELEDTYIRLDRDLARLLEFLDIQIGKNKYLLFLTADHGSSDNPNFLEEAKISSGHYDVDSLKTYLNNKLSEDFGAFDYISYIDNMQIYINPQVFNKQKVIEKVEEHLYSIKGIKNISIPSFRNRPLSNIETGYFIENSFNSNRSGDIYFQFYPGWMQNLKYGTTHSSAYNNDTHVPLIWYGYNIKKRESIKYYPITSIIPTLSLLLNIPLPNEANKIIIEELLD